VCLIESDLQYKKIPIKESAFPSIQPLLKRLSGEKVVRPQLKKLKVPKV
jgi:hypothetical protein